MASRALKQLGEKAFQPLKVGDIWHKPAVSAKALAKLRRQTKAEGRYRCAVSDEVICAPLSRCGMHNSLTLSAIIVSGNLINRPHLDLLVS